MARKRKLFAPRESLIQQAVIDHWRALGVPGSLVAAIPNARAAGQAGLTKGLFDLVVMSPTLGDRTGWLELKADDGELSDDQNKIKLIMIARGLRFIVTPTPVRRTRPRGRCSSTSAPGAIRAR